tara:strand:- start:69 stop:299 length:231 start_codon:yes stop_codon:yes gene_type:complete
MTNKGFEAEISIAETPNFRATEDKPLKYDPKQTKKVDINVLKARVQKIQSRENKKNLIIFAIFLVALSTMGVVLSI